MSKAEIVPVSSPCVTIPSPIMALDVVVARQAGVALYIKRDDLIHPDFGGNKWRKLKYNLHVCAQSTGRSLLTFGGAFSNHLWATAAVGAAFGVGTIGVVRGEPEYAENPTLRQARAWGMHLHFVSRGEYRRRNDSEYWNELRARFGDVYIVPEGGSNAAALPGVAEGVAEIRAQLGHFDTLCCAVGSGGTLAGIARVLQPRERALGIVVLRGATALPARIEHLLDGTGGEWSLTHDYHAGGYARVTPALLRFCDDFADRHGFRLDPVYTGKMMMGIYDRLAKGLWAPGSTVVGLHSGGLQGWAGMATRSAR